MLAEKYQSELLHDRCRLLSFLFYPLMKYAWCRQGNVRSASCGDASFLTSIGHLSWPTLTGIFFDQYRWKIFFCRDGLMFSWPNKWEHASFGRYKKSVELAQKSLDDLHCTFFMQHQNKKTSSAVKKNIICQRAFLKKNCAILAEKYQSSYFTIDVGYWVFYSIP